jgi:hypothetical protein
MLTLFLISIQPGNLKIMENDNLQFRDRRAESPVSS